MKTKIPLLGVALACTAAGLTTMGCANGSARSANGELVLNLYDTTCVNWQTNIVQPPVSDSTGYWDSTYTNRKLCYGTFVLDHVGIAAWNYWGGFTFGRNGSTTNYGYHEDSIGSVDWIPHQWGVIAGGGIDEYSDRVVTKVDTGIPYLIAFGSGIDVWLKDSALFYPIGVFICNHPWPYWGNFFGDGFARPLDSVGDHFVLKITGIKTDGSVIETVTDTLAKYDANAKHKVWQSNKWHWVSLEDIQDETQILRFELETTDVGQWGANTAFYFCMDKLKVEADTRSADAKKFDAKKAAVKKPKKAVEEFGDFLTVGTHVAGDAVLHNAQGQVALRAVLKAGSNKLDTKKLPAGEYTLVHHHRVKHFVKK
jgi:hypothetical protein